MRERKRVRESTSRETYATPTNPPGKAAAAASEPNDGRLPRPCLGEAVTVVTSVRNQK